MGDGQIPAETTVKINGGAAPWGTGMRGEITLETEIKFEGKFCSLHPGTAIEYEETYTGNGREEKFYYCRQCLDAFKWRFEHLLSEARVDCENVDHGHECRCWIGHDCDTDPCHVQEELRRRTHKPDGTPRLDESGNPVEPNAMEVLGAEAPNRAMLGVVQRIARLEEENESLRSVIRKLIGLLPEDAREALGSPEILLGSPGGTSV